MTELQADVRGGVEINPAWGLGSGPEDFILAHHGWKAQIGLNHPAFRA
jgi:hypothetical protein